MRAHMKVMRSSEDIRQKTLELHDCVENAKGSLSRSEIEIDLDLEFQDIIFPQSVPHSVIVYEDDINFQTNNFKDRAKHKIYRLYYKYISQGGELEINISHRSRQVFIQMMDDYSKWMNDVKYSTLDPVFLMHIFDKCIAQMTALLKSSYMRFKNSNQFAKLSQLMFLP